MVPRFTGHCSPQCSMQQSDTSMLSLQVTMLKCAHATQARHTFTTVWKPCLGPIFAQGAAAHRNIPVHGDPAALCGAIPLADGHAQHGSQELKQLGRLRGQQLIVSCCCMLRHPLLQMPMHVAVMTHLPLCTDWAAVAACNALHASMQVLKTWARWSLTVGAEPTEAENTRPPMCSTLKASRSPWTGAAAQLLACYALCFQQ